jgi:hypothetical protein
MYGRHAFRLLHELHWICTRRVNFRQTLSTLKMSVSMKIKRKARCIFVYIWNAVDGWMTGVRFPAELGCLLYTASTSALRPTQLPSRWVPRVSFPWGGGVQRLGQETDRWHPSNECMELYLKPHTSLWPWYLVKHRDFAFTLHTDYLQGRKCLLKEAVNLHIKGDNLNLHCINFQPLWQFGTLVKFVLLLFILINRPPFSYKLIIPCAHSPPAGSL